MKKCTAAFLFVLIASVAIGQHPSFTVTKKGKGAPVLFLPGFATPASVWDETVASLDGGKEVHLFTYAGFGGVAPIDTPWYSVIKRDLVAYIVKQDLSHIAIVGHSMGGTLALDLAAAVPGRVDKLVLVDALPSMRDLMMPGVSADKIQYNTPYNNQALKMSDEAFRKNAAMMAGGMTTNKEKAETIANWIIGTDRKTYVYGFTDLLKLDLRDDLLQVKAAALVLGATFPTKEIARATFEKQYANLTNKHIEMAPDSKHFIMFDQPQWFHAQVNAFLK